MSERSQAYILTKQESKVSQVIKILYKSKKWVMKWYIYGEAGDFSHRKGSGRPINPCFLVKDRK